MPKWGKLIIAVLLLPLCVGAAQALWLVMKVSASGRGDLVWAPLLAGAACWLAIFLLLPKPMWLYVVGHELTHAVWVWLFGGRVKKLKATAQGGHVVVTRNNFLIALAPYFFPFYAVIVMLLFLLGNVVWGWRDYVVWFHLLLGAAYSFHVTLTWRVLQTEQSDITSQGWLFSFVVIWLGNVFVLLLGLPLLTERVSVWSALAWTLQATGGVIERLGHLLH